MIDDETPEYGDQSENQELEDSVELPTDDAEHLNDASSSQPPSDVIEEAHPLDVEPDFIDDVDAPEPIEQEVLPDEDEETSETGSTIRIDKVTSADGQVNIGNFYSYEQSKREEEGKPVLRSLGVTWEKLEEVFVYPTSEEAKIDQLDSERRLLIIYGRENSGRFAFAVRAGLDLLKKSAVQSRNFIQYKRTQRETRSLLDFVDYLAKEENKDKKPTVYILRNGFRSGIDLQELNDDAPQLERVLLELQSYLIITTDDFAEDRLTTGSFSAFHAAIGRDQIGQVFDKHLERYSKPAVERSYLTHPLRELVKGEALRDRLIRILERPASVDRFFDKLTGLDIRGESEDERKVEELAKRISTLEYEPARAWFQKLRPNARLFALIGYLFDGFDRLLLNKLFAEAVEFLREQGITNLRDAREFGLNDLLQQIHARENDSGLIEFEHASFRQEVGLQIENYYHQLWMLVPPFLNLFKQDPFIRPEYWYERAVVGSALARVGIYDKSALELKLSELANHDSGAVVAIAGSTLNELCRLAETYRRTEYYVFALGILHRWVESKRPDLMWAVGAAAWRMYDTLVGATNSSDAIIAEPAQAALNELDNHLTRLAQIHDEFSIAWRKELEKNIRETASSNKMSLREQAQAYQLIIQERQLDNLNSIVHAIHQIFQNNPRRAIDLLKRWLSENADDNLKVAGVLAADRLFSINQEENIRLSAERHLPMLELIGPFLRATEQFGNLLEQARTMVRTLLAWINRGGTEWIKPIHTELLRVVNRASREEHTLMRAVLSDIWLRSTSEEARVIGQALVARSLVMDGEPLALPRQRAGLIVFDLARLGRHDLAGPEAARHLFELLDPRVDVQATGLGLESISIDSVSKMSDYQTLLWHYPHALPRLLYPVLEALNPNDYFFTLVLTWGAILDIDDVLETDWRDQLLIITTTRHQLQIQVGTETKDLLHRHLQQGWHRDVLHVQDVSRVIGNRLARSLATLSSIDWWTPLREYLVTYLPDLMPDEEPDPAAVAAALDELVSRIDEIEYARHPRDVTRTIACGLIWMAKADFHRVVELINDWLCDTRGEVYPLMGSAGARLLFNLYAYSEPIPPLDPYGDFLRLLLPLAHNLVTQNDYDGVDAALKALRHWIRDPSWYERVLFSPNNDSIEIFQLIDECRPNFAKPLRSFLDELEKPMIHEGEEETPASVRSWINQLRVRLALGSDEPLPDLAECERYGLIIVDAGENSTSTRRFLASSGRLLLERIQNEAKKSNSTFRIVPLLYRMGQTFPVIQGIDEKIKDDQLFPVDLWPHPQLLMPLLEKSGADRAAFLFIMTTNELRDADDWLDDWHAKTLVYWSRADNPAWLARFHFIERRGRPEEVVEVAWSQIRAFVEKALENCGEME